MFIIVAQDYSYSPNRPHIPHSLITRRKKQQQQPLPKLSSIPVLNRTPMNHYVVRDFSLSSGMVWKPQRTRRDTEKKQRPSACSAVNIFWAHKKLRIYGQKIGDIIVDREKIKMFSSRYRGSVRMASGLFYSNNEYEEWRNTVLNKKLP